MGAVLFTVFSTRVMGWVMATTLTPQNKEYVPHAWEEVPCPFCATTAHRPHEKYGPNHRYTYVQCKQCDLVYANPRPAYDAGFVDTAYSIYDVESHHMKNAGQLDGGQRKTVEQFKITLRQIEQELGRKGSVIDIGCHTGLFLKAAQEEGWTTTGVDISKAMTDAVTKYFGIPTYCAQYHELDLSSHGKFDVIYCSHVIEHIPNPNSWVAKFRNELAPDGVLCLNVPNQFSLDRKFKRALKKVGLKKDNWELWRTPDHLYEPHLKSMRYLLEKNGFQISQAFTYSRKEDSKPSAVNRLVHHSLKTGSKLRIFARPLSN